MVPRNGSILLVASSCEGAVSVWRTIEVCDAADCLTGKSGGGQLGFHDLVRGDWL